MMRKFFVFDTARCKADEDDPKDAVLYYFPVQTLDHCYSLCCQIVGVAKFFKANFSSPSLIVLDQEKYALHWSGKYLFVLGGSSSIHGTALKNQLLFLLEIFCFYHGSINNLMKICKNNREEFLAKMELAWSRYITLIQHYKNLLQLPVNTLPTFCTKKHAETLTKANQLLHLCQMSSSVIAGAVFCNSRVISSQLPPKISNYLTLMSNENAAFPVRNVLVQNLPPDVELKYVYLNQKVIQNIVKCNHKQVGSSVRIKHNEMPQRKQRYIDSLSSGSEGDVDSGNYTEISHKHEISELSMKKSKYFKLHFKTQLLCCTLHSTVLKKDMLRNRNKIFLKYIKSEFISEKLKIFRKKAPYLNITAKSLRKEKGGSKTSFNDAVPSFNLPCHRHADIFSRNFVSKSVLHKHVDLSSACDSEYSCYFCINHQFSSNLPPFYLKNWNSDILIPEYFKYIPLKSNSLQKYNVGKNKRTMLSKIQILKCRSKNDNYISHLDGQKDNLNHTKKYPNENVFSDFESKNLKHQVYQIPQSLSRCETCENVAYNNLEKSVLYVQRCGVNMLLLLLNKNYDEHIFTYLWNCGFSYLTDLNAINDTKVEDSEIDPNHYTLMYDDVQKSIKERPYGHCLFSEKNIKESIQTFQDDFHSNSKLHMVTILSANQSIYACQSRQKSAYYLQQDVGSKKLESLCNFSKKAVRRLEKYLNFSA